ncbi:bifunctional riboflavin kinase/FAD synthetase [Hugenholtzia roseola]|uniref:bifunctional riboflavin kinase/FAD synthetase n=1 Tax=Hugenholtzia roseola TaxID=1002 RepID=UPI0004298969|nr:bifunctional riboflavin kinase/FAD synthetase [Hugenholtzia roseola]
MQIHKEIAQFPQTPYTILTTGTFDGVHLGHQKILERLLALKAQQAGAETVLLTYHPHPRKILFPHQPLAQLHTLEEKAAKLAQIGIDHLCLLSFDSHFAQTSPEDFVQQVLIARLQTKHFIIGYDHRFGKDRAGDFHFLYQNRNRFGFQVEEIPKQTLDEVAISSSKIRKALAEGNIKFANLLLGYAYSLSGIVVKGNQIGRTLGYPTANLLPSADKLIPAKGIYAVWVWVGKVRYGGMLSIGDRPTIGANLETTIEVNLFDFTGDLYGEELRLEFVEFLRKEEKYEGLSALRQQLEKDEQQSRLLLQIFS